jgi:hypothetical protein
VLTSTPVLVFRGWRGRQEILARWWRRRGAGTISWWKRRTSLGGDLIAAGLDDLRRGLETIPALLVSIGAARLSRVGYTVPQPLSEPEQRLYHLLAQDDPAAAHSRYNGLIRRLVSFERAAELSSRNPSR